MNAAAPQNWSRPRWLTFVLIVLAAHVALIFLFGERKPVVPRAVVNVPRLELADDASELLALNDPTLFARPNAKDFSSLMQPETSAAAQPSFRWTEPPRWLQLPAEQLGATFGQFMETNQFVDFQIEPKPSARLNSLALPAQRALPQNSTLQIAGALAQRRLLHPVDLPSLPCNDVIAPDKVQVLVDADGSVISAVLLASDDNWETAGRTDLGDANALAIARTLRFAPAPQPAVGELIFHWRTIPLPATNAPGNSP